MTVGKDIETKDNIICGFCWMISSIYSTFTGPALIHRPSLAVTLLGIGISYISYLDIVEMSSKVVLITGSFTLARFSRAWVQDDDR